MVFIKKYNKDVLPYHIYPLKDEIFSSWICRLAFKSNISISAFTRFYLGKVLNLSFWNTDLEILPEVYRFLKNSTFLSDEQVTSMFIESYNGIIFNNSEVSRNNLNFLSKGHRYCPGCFRKSIPYYKKQWRLITSVICSECKCYLVEKCPECNYPIIFYKSNMEVQRLLIKKRKPIHFCCNCDFDFRNSNVEIADSHELEYQNYIDNSIIAGYTNFSQYSFSYIVVLLILVKNLRSSNNKTKRFLKEVNEIYNWGITPTSIDIRNWNEIERRNALVLGYHLLKNLDVLSDMFKRSKVKKQTITTAKEGLPYWFEKVFY